jgi:hypothetical protein
VYVARNPCLTLGYGNTMPLSLSAVTAIPAKPQEGMETRRKATHTVVYRRAPAIPAEPVRVWKGRGKWTRVWRSDSTLWSAPTIPA